ncbi:hypothetical protein XBI1_2650018 [Xenorhabdus bovienii str. Intermedium]|uniref:Uncharacterized protein n=1 Tax=Xenorhabdus bovienii str. Intermedium TaxID=1379677 RepID=A0A077QJH0_XENBV|nr:hypothetical protein XBI1_2650018 [Xenorhabdus bovienii str. Intermedium]
MRFFKKAMRQHGQPDGVTLDKSGANKAALDEINKEKPKNITTTNHSIHDQTRGLSLLTKSRLNVQFEAHLVSYDGS